MASGKLPGDQVERQCCVDGSGWAGDWFGEVVGKALSVRQVISVAVR
jgi:hypothetical protein